MTPQLARYMRIYAHELGLSLSPPWSVHATVRPWSHTCALINSHKFPASNATLTHLHDLVALVPPAEGTPRFEEPKREGLVRLVDAVRVAPDGAKGLDAPPSRSLATRPLMCDHTHTRRPPSHLVRATVRATRPAVRAGHACWRGRTRSQ